MRTCRTTSRALSVAIITLTFSFLIVCTFLLLPRSAQALPADVGEVRLPKPVALAAPARARQSRLNAGLRLEPDGALLQGADVHALATTLHVSKTSCSAPGSGSAADPFCTIQYAANHSDEDDTILISGDVYTEAGITATHNLTFKGAGAGATIVQAAADQASASDRVFHITGGTDVSVTFISMTVRHGNRAGGRGGGIRAEAFLTLVDTEVISNYAGTLGGGAYAYRDATLGGGLFEDNHAGESGAGLYVWAGDLVMADTQFMSNTLTNNDGGGAYVKSGDATLDGGLFRGNSAKWFGGGLYVNGGRLHMTDTRFISNTCDNVGGGAYVSNGNATLVGGRFEDNWSGLGGGVLVNNGELEMTDTEFVSNTANGHGGGAYVDLGNAALNGGLFQGNWANNDGGGLYVKDGSLTVTGSPTGTQFISNTAYSYCGANCGRGGGAWVSSTVTLDGGLFQHNWAHNEGGGLYLDQGSLYMTDTQFISNTARQRDGGGASVENGDAALSGGSFEDNWADERGGGLCVYLGSLDMHDTDFILNTSQVYGGGAYVGNEATLNGGLFQGNWAGDDGGGLYADDYLYMTDTEFTSNESHGGLGGGAYVVWDATLSGGLFKENWVEDDGGGLYLDWGSLYMTDTRFISNTAHYYHGGGACLNAGDGRTYADARLIGGLFQGNCAAAYGGGLFVSEGILYMDGTDFVSNKAERNSGGGAFVAYDATLINGSFEDNYADDAGGGLYLADGGVTMSGTEFISNTADTLSGGGAWVSNTATLDGGSFQGNWAYLSGGGLNVDDGSLNMTNIQFFSNTTYGDGGGAWVSNTVTLNGGHFQENYAKIGGGGLLVLDGNLHLTGTKFFSNTAAGDEGGGAYLEEGDARLHFGVFQDNWSNDGGGLYVDEGSLTMTGTQFFSNTASPGDGGGAYVGNRATLNGGLFQDNFADGEGGGLYLDGGNLAMTGTQFISNTASSEDGGGALVGAYNDATLNGGLFRGNSAGLAGGGLSTIGDLSMTGTQFFSNTASTDNGGAAYVNGDAVVEAAYFESNTAGSSGGGLCVFEGDLHMTDTQFISNTASTETGGGLYVYEGYLHMSDAVFVFNTAGADGGGAYVYYDATLVNGSFEDNYANSDGGGLYVWDGSLTMTGTEFISNSASTESGGGAYVDEDAILNGGRFERNRSGLDGGGLYCAGAVAVTGTQFVDNHAGPVNGLLSAPAPEVQLASETVPDGGGMAVGRTVSIQEGLFEGNRAESLGGGLWHGSGSLTIRRSQFIGNLAGYSGGALYHSGGSEIVNTLFARNAAGTDGQVMYIDGLDDTLDIVHCTVVSPTVSSGTAIYLGYSTVNISNTIVASYTTGIDNVCGTVKEDHNLFWPTSMVSGTGTVNHVTYHSFYGDPAFVNPAVDDYHLGLGSAAIDAAPVLTPPVTVDLDGTARPLGAAPDIGAFEGLPLPDLAIAKAAAPAAAHPGDPFTFTLTYSNAGQSIATGVVISDEIHGLLVVEDVASSGAAISDTGTIPPYVWEVEDLAPGEAGVISITGRLYDRCLPPSTAIGLLGNQASIACQEPETDLGNNQSGDVLQLLATQPPTVTFTATPTSCCVPLSVHFSDTSTAGHGPIVERWWDFGDGATSTLSDTVHTYTAGGTYSVTLTVTDSHGCTDTRTEAAYVIAHEVTANLNAVPEPGCAPMSVSFSDCSTAVPGPVDAWHWDLGDGATSTLSDPTHEYECPGTFFVTLTVTDTHGCTDTHQDSVEIPPCLEVTKTDRQDPVTAANWVRYDIEVTNIGPHVMDEVLLTDTIPDGMYWVKAEGNAGWTHEDGVVTRLITNLQPGQSVTFELVLGTHSSASGLKINTVVAEWDCTEVSASESTLIRPRVVPPIGPTPTATGRPHCPDPYEPNDTTYEAWAVTPRTLWSYICCGTPPHKDPDEDYFRFAAKAGQTIAISLTEVPQDYDLCLYGPDRAQVGCSRHRGTQPEHLQHEALTAGDYYAHVFGYSAGDCHNTLTYRMEIAVGAGQPVIVDTPTPTPTTTGEPGPTATPSGTATQTPPDGTPTVTPTGTTIPIPTLHQVFLPLMRRTVPDPPAYWSEPHGRRISMGVPVGPYV